MGKEEIQLFLFAEDKIFYAGSPKESTKIYNKVKGYKINIENENQDNISPDFCQNGYYQEKQIISISKDV